jgi:hypothetical protein
MVSSREVTTTKLCTPRKEMKRRVFLASILTAAAIPSAVAYFDHDHEGNGKHKGEDRDDDNGDDKHHRREQEHARYFRTEDRALLSRYYPVRSLPPGLRKKYARTGTLPPGWQKRLQPLPVTVIQQLPPLPPNCERGYVDGYAVVYDRRTRVILDTVDLIGALTGRF